MRTLLGFLRKEFKQTLRDPRMRVLMFVAPCVQLTIFGVALSTEARHIRLSIVGANRDFDFNNIYRECLASGWFVPAKVSTNDPYEQIQQDEADAVLVAPLGGLTRSLGRSLGEIHNTENRGGQDTKLQLLVNAINSTRAQSIERYFLMILQRYFSDRIALPIQFDIRILYNPGMQSAFFLIPGVMSMLVCLITILLTSMSIAKEKEVGTLETLLAAPIRPSEVLLGKTLPYVILGVSNIPLIMVVAVFVFSLPLRGSLALLMISSAIFVLCTVGIGLLISMLAKNQQQSMMGGFLFLFPAMLLSGLVFPIENMPWAVRVFSYLNPLTYFIEILRNLTLKGGDLRLIFFNDMILLVMAVIVIYVSWRRFKVTL